ncbi:hypothetical protein HDE77_003694 [Rhodanobacter sp. MP7CTX1]|nr:hypothetical protein [Rhodanobacter sp. MP7CTX1]
MALIKCKDCNADVSDAALACPTCGRPMAFQASATERASPPPETRMPKPRNPTRGIALLILACVAGLIFWMYLSPISHSTVDIQLPSAARAKPATAPAATSTANQAPATDDEH